MVRNILLLGDPRLYETSELLTESELPEIKAVIEDLHDTLIDFQSKYHAGRAIAAPQIGIKKRLLYLYIDHPVVFINPVLSFPGADTMELMDNCMSFPRLYVKVKRYQECVIRYRDLNWNECEMHLSGDLSELLQHEYDHLDGILATMRAVDLKSFSFLPPVKESL